jgi:plastocyanin
MILAAPAHHPPARVQVVAQEFHYSLSRTKVRAGRVIVELVNDGQDTHDLDLQRMGSTHIIRFPKVQPGHFVDRELKLVPGRYMLWCTIANHRMLGMQAMLRVVRSKPTR